LSRHHGLESLPVEHALTDEALQDRPYNRERLSASPFIYLRRGIYVDYLNRLWRLFPPVQVGVFFFEKLISSAQYLASVFDFLNVEPDFTPQTSNTAYNTSNIVAEGLPASVEEFLTLYFAEPNAGLADKLNIELPGWRI
jgi:hypothetical protein